MKKFWQWWDFNLRPPEWQAVMKITIGPCHSPRLNIFNQIPQEKIHFFISIFLPSFLLYVYLIIFPPILFRLFLCFFLFQTFSFFRLFFWRDSFSLLGSSWWPCQSRSIFRCCKKCRICCRFPENIRCHFPENLDGFNLCFSLIKKSKSCRKHSKLD